MYFHWQNLNEHYVDGRSVIDGSGWKHGRAWLKVGRVTINPEWVFGKLAFSLGFSVFSGENRDGIGLSIHLPFVALWLNASGVFSRALVDRRATRLGYDHDRAVRIHVADRGVYWTVWRSDMAGWNRDVPRWRQGSFQFPWAWEHVRHEWLRPDGTVYRAPEKGEYDVPSEITEMHSYAYKLENSDVQLRTATINGEEREWRWRWFTWLPWPRKVQRCIDVQFSDEVGERTGSWKGGTIGCSWEWRHGETMLDALRRMERERKFN